MLRPVKVSVIFWIVNICAAVINTQNDYQTYINSIKMPNVQFKELFDKESLADADLILNAFSSINEHFHEDYDYREEDMPCKWHDNTKCLDIYEPVCVTDLQCIYVVRNKCQLDKMNCGCVSHHILPASFCDNFSQPLFKRCNIKIFIQ